MFDAIVERLGRDAIELVGGGGKCEERVFGRSGDCAKQ